MVGVAAPKLSESRPTALFSFSLPIYEQTAGLQRYASDWNSVQIYASKSHRVGACRPRKPARKRAIHCKPMLPAVQTFGWS